MLARVHISMLLSVKGTVLNVPPTGCFTVKVSVSGRASPSSTANANGDKQFYISMLPSGKGTVFVYPLPLVTV